MPSRAGGDLIIHYTFSDNNEVTATNTGSLGSAADGVITGGSIISSPLSPDGLGLLLDGQMGSGIEIPNAFDYGNELTIESLVRLDVPNGDVLNVVFDDYGSPGVLMGVNQDGLVRLTVSTTSGRNTIHSSQAFSIGDWHHLAGVYDGSQVKLYVDGVLVAKTAATGAVLNHANVTPNIGVESDGSVFPWNGAIDDFKIYDRARSIPEPVSPAAAILLVTGYLGVRRRRY